MSDEKNYSVFVNHPSGDPDITPRTILHSTDSIKEARDYIQTHRQGDGILAKVMHTVGPERRLAGWLQLTGQEILELIAKEEGREPGSLKIGTVIENPAALTVEQYSRDTQLYHMNLEVTPVTRKLLEIKPHGMKPEQAEHAFDLMHGVLNIMDEELKRAGFTEEQVSPVFKRALVKLESNKSNITGVLMMDPTIFTKHWFDL